MMFLGSTPDLTIQNQGRKITASKGFKQVIFCLSISKRSGTPMIQQMEKN